MSFLLFKDDILFLQRFLKSSGLYAGKLDGIWGPKTEAAALSFEAQSISIAQSFGTFDIRSEQNITTLHLKAQPVARIMMKTLVDAGMTVRILSGTRTYAEQNALFSKGRFGNPPPIVTNAKGGRSLHNFSIAWDIGLFSPTGKYMTSSSPYDLAGQIVMSLNLPGLEWGGTWTTFVDRPHYQMFTGLDLTVVRDRFESGQPYL